MGKSNFEILKQMATENKDIRQFTTMVEANKTKLGGVVGVGVDSNTLHELALGTKDFFTILLIVDANQYLEIAEGKDAGIKAELN